ncbi:pirin family protein [Jeongeupia naejangsanensis]|uniref:Pirin family protein n=1 Tax=Jeongeupia naejangsanensis TaxID=613195 RepID=A0ABS2BP22_9NEIS|nr:pirin family protein [Jeongeupia naejangsanensis]MBM3116736.1 pirin family protein [Jeongeupia naejangsanensis]
MTTASYRRIARIVRGMATSDGGGVRLNRVIGSQDLPMLDPFLLLDEFRSDNADDYLAGFPEHPHRGFETVTYMLAGQMQHGDNKGNTGNLGPGSVQWMTAGRGIVHSEMPQQENGLLQGFQLWVNLPASDKMTAPRYQEFAASEIPQVALDGGGSVKVIAGTFGGVTGPVSGVATQPSYYDVILPAGATLDLTMPAEHHAFIYVYQNVLSVVDGPQERPVKQGELAALTQGDTIAVGALEQEVRFIVVAGKPLNETVARYGPFVMNTAEEVQQAFVDFQQGLNGFERA